MTLPSSPEDTGGPPSRPIWKVVMAASSASVDQVFVLRCWRETHDCDQADAGWRVKISHVNSRRRLHAQGLDRAFEVVRSALETSLDNQPEAQR
jgi:hypothetical protein